MATRKEARSGGNEELVAAQVYDFRARPDEFKMMRDVITASKNSSAQPRKWFRSIGEINFGISRGAKIAGYATINAYKRNDDGTPGDIVTDHNVGKIAAMLGSPYGGQRALIERYFMLQKVPGDAFLIRTRDSAGNHDGYDFVGAHEWTQPSLDGIDLRASKPAHALKRQMLPAGSSGDAYTIDVEPEDFLGRIWRPSMEFAFLAASPLAALDTQCEILHLLTLGLKSKLLSRLAMNGILYWPSEVNQIKSAIPGGNGQLLNGTVLDKLVTESAKAILNYEDPQSALPIFATGPAAYSEAIRHIILDREIYAGDMALRAELIDRILVGLDVQKAQTTGENSGETRFNMWASSDDEIRIQVRPDMETLMWALTRLVLNREMTELGTSEGTQQQYMFWYDLSRASVSANQAEDARQGYDRGTVNAEAVRRAANFGDEDKMEGDELVRWIGQKTNNPFLALWGTDQHKDIDWDQVAAVGSTKKGPNESTPADKPETSPGNNRTKTTPKAAAIHAA